MIGKTSTVSAAVLLLVAWTVAVSQSTDQKRTLIINGQSTQVPVIQVNGHPYVGLQALAEAIKGSLSNSGNVIALSLPIGSLESVPPQIHLVRPHARRSRIGRQIRDCPGNS